ncbi:fungal-specific transcription factor domain-containing protein [Mucidula mucida]|nr:fungal-specific transcription factor domain-containing protein [Mucidula mucida]
MAKDQSANGNEPKPRRKPGRVPTSCAECRRLKLRCDKNVPCEKCVSRGCGSICPEGSLTTGKGNRLVLANTEQLHDRIEHLCSRIRELETALKQLSGGSHPLLRQDLLQLKATQSSRPAPPQNGNNPTIAESKDESFIDAFGTLTIGLDGESNFLGKTARSEYLIRVLSKPQSDSTLVLPRVSKRVIQYYCSDTTITDEEIGHEVFNLLPPLSEAVRLCEVYLEGGRYLYAPLPRKELFDEVLMGVYRAESFPTMSPSCHHKLSLLFAVFALACLLDQEKHAYSVEAQEYFYLSKAAFGFSSINRNTTLHAIQAMLHFSQYQELSDWESLGNNQTWTTMGAAVRVAQSIGLHLNSARWKLNEDLTQRRSRLFWQLYTYDVWQSFQYGRPPIMSKDYIDCPFPIDTEETIGADGGRESGLHNWTFQYTTLVHTVMSAAFGSKVPPYSVVVDLDRKIRDFPVPSELQACSTTGDQSAIHYMRRWLVLMYKETVLLHLHRAYFAQALQDQPEDLTRHRYLPSVMSTYRSAWRMIQGLRMVRINAPLLSARVALVWSHALSGAIAMCILVTRAPASKMTKPSLAELDTVAELFEAAASTCRPAQNLLDTIMALKQKAHDAVDNQGQVGQRRAQDMSPDELDRLGGKTHLISSASPTIPPQQPSYAYSGSGPFSYSPPVSSPSTVASNSPSSSFSIAAPGVPGIHPTITADMRIMDVINTTFDLSPNLFDFPTPDSNDRMTDIQFTAGMSGIGEGNNIFGGSDVNGMGMGMGDFGGVGAGGAAQGNGSGNNLGSPNPFGFGATPPPMLDATWQSFVEQLGF